MSAPTSIRSAASSYEMLTGARASSDRKPVPSKTLEKIVSRCLETDPARRWQSADELVSALEAPRAEKNLIGMVSAAAVLVMLLIASYFFLRHSPKLTDKDTIVLADFVNNTGDPVFDGTLRQGLTIQLAQSPFLKIMEDAQVQQVLRLMSLPPGARILLKSRTKSASAKEPRPPSAAPSRAWGKATSSHSRRSPARTAQRSPANRSRRRTKSTC